MFTLLSKRQTLATAALTGLLAFSPLLRADAPTEKLPTGAKVVRLVAFPQSIKLQNGFDYRQVVITAVLSGGESIDATRMATFTAPAGFVKISERGQVRPVADGSGEVKFSLAGTAGSIPVQVGGMGTPPDVGFVRDVMPILSKVGCNAGTCHGSAKGKNGFALSLRGYDPLFDHRSLTDDVEARRFNRSAPEKSLMLLKPAGAVAHVGSVLFQAGDPYYEIIRAWIAGGVKLDLDSPRVVKIEVVPQSSVLPLPGMKQQIAVLASYSNGQVRDVSAEAFIESSNTEVAKVDKHGLVEAIRRGEAAMLARYEGAYAAATLIVMGDRSGFVWKDAPVNNYIDELVYEKLKSVKVQPSDLCADAEFVRRVYIDLTGLPPGVEDVRAFLADSRPSKIKRDALVDRLVGSPEFIEHWTNKWADLLQVNRRFLGEQGAAALRNWIREAVAKNMPYNHMAYKLLTGSGSNLENPAASYFKILRDPDTAMENTTHLFLAVRFNCNKCHDHPFERWTQGQYYHLASFFSQIGRSEDPKFKGQQIPGSAVRGPLPLVELVSDIKSGEVTNPRTGEAAAPEFPFTIPHMPGKDLSRREQLARWATATDNPYFAKSYVNRVWSYLLGVGLIEPVDDIRAGNPPTNPKLLDRMTQEFIKSGFNVQELMKTICKSRAYQHSVLTNAWNRDDETNYSHALARRLPAEVLFDAIHRCTGAVTHLPGLPAGARAAQLLDTNVEVPGAFLDLFGRPPRESACECERSNSSMLLGPVLNLVNGPVIANALKDPSNRLNQLVAKEADDKKLVQDLYLSMLCRLPTAGELEIGTKALKGNDEEFTKLIVEHKRLESELAAYEKELDVRQVQWEKDMQTRVDWIALEPETYTSRGGAILQRLADKSVLASGKNPSPEQYTISAFTNLTGITGVRLEVLADPSLPSKGPGRAPNGNLVLSEFKLAVGKPGEAAKAAALHRPQADFNQPDFDIAKAIDNNAGTGWAIGNEFGKNHVAVFETKEKIGFPGGTILTFTLDQQFAGKEHNIGRLRLAVTTMNTPLPLRLVPENIAQILKIAPERRTAEQKAALTAHFRAPDGELARRQRALAEHTLPASPRAMGAQDLAWALLNTPEFLFNH